jgi:hypothetical protein
MDPWTRSRGSTDLVLESLPMQAEESCAAEFGHSSRKRTTTNQAHSLLNGVFETIECLDRSHHVSVVGLFCSPIPNKANNRPRSGGSGWSFPDQWNRGHTVRSTRTKYEVIGKFLRDERSCFGPSGLPTLAVLFRFEGLPPYLEDLVLCLSKSFATPQVFLRLRLC